MRKVYEYSVIASDHFFVQLYFSATKKGLILIIKIQTSIMKSKVLHLECIKIEVDLNECF